MPDIRLLDSLTLPQAYQVAQDAGMYLVTDGRTVVVSPLILPGWREVPMVLRPPRHAAQASDPSADILDKVAA